MDIEFVLHMFFNYRKAIGSGDGSIENICACVPGYNGR
jgi:hypothetical protein